MHIKLQATSHHFADASENCKVMFYIRTVVDEEDHIHTVVDEEDHIHTVVDEEAHIHTSTQKNILHICGKQS